MVSMAEIAPVGSSWKSRIPEISRFALPPSVHPILLSCLLRRADTHLGSVGMQPKVGSEALGRGTETVRAHSVKRKSSWSDSLVLWTRKVAGTYWEE